MEVSRTERCEIDLHVLHCEVLYVWLWKHNDSVDDQWATVVVLPVQNFIVGFHRYMYVDATFDCSRHVDVSAILDRSTSFPRFHNIVHPLVRYFYLFIMHKKYSRSFITLRLNHWCHINYFNIILTTFLGLEHGSYVAVYGGSESSGDFIKNILICVLKMNEGLASLEQHEGE